MKSASNLLSPAIFAAALALRPTAALADECLPAAPGGTVVIDPVRGEPSVTVTPVLVPVAVGTSPIVVSVPVEAPVVPTNAYGPYLPPVFAVPPDTLGAELPETMPALERARTSAYASDATLLDLPDTMPALRSASGAGVGTSVEEAHEAEQALRDAVTSEARVVLAPPVLPASSAGPEVPAVDGPDRTGADGLWVLDEAVG